MSENMVFRAFISKTVLVIGTYLLISACTDKPKGLLDHSENDLGLATNWLGTDHREFHSILHFPHGFSLNMPGYVVGIEKSRKSKLKGHGNLGQYLLPSSSIPEPHKNVYKKVINDLKTHLVTHIMKYYENGRERAKASSRVSKCSLYSALSVSHENKQVSFDDDPAKTLFQSCKPSVRGKGVKTLPHDTNNDKQSDVFGEAINSLRGDFKDNLINDIERRPYTHIIVTTMGWNTTQKNAIQNFNSVMGHLLDEALSVNCEKGKAYDHNHICSFNPLFVGVTWPSEWALSAMSFIPDAVVRLASFPNKALDAREIGATWLKEVIENVKFARDRANIVKKPKIVLLGHSFGAKAVLQSLITPSFIKGGYDGEFVQGDMFIGLQGAFRTSELKHLFASNNADEGIRPKESIKDLNVVLVMSAHDRAVKIPSLVGAKYAGGISSFDDICVDKQHKLHKYIDCRRVGSPTKTVYNNAEYGFSLCSRDDFSKRSSDDILNINAALFSDTGNNITLVDASTVVNCPVAFSGGLAHSDIYRRETSRLILDIMYQKNARNNQSLRSLRKH